MTTIIWLIAVYATVLGVKLLIQTKGDSRGLGMGLLIAVFGWAGIAASWEYVFSVVIRNPDETSTLSVPIFPLHYGVWIVDGADQFHAGGVQQSIHNP